MTSEEEQEYINQFSLILDRFRAGLNSELPNFKEYYDALQTLFEEIKDSDPQSFEILKSKYLHELESVQDKIQVHQEKEFETIKQLLKQKSLESLHLNQLLDSAEEYDFQKESKYFFPIHRKSFLKSIFNVLLVWPKKKKMRSIKPEKINSSTFLSSKSSKISDPVFSKKDHFAKSASKQKASKKDQAQVDKRVDEKIKIDKKIQQKRDTVNPFPQEVSKKQLKKKENNPVKQKGGSQKSDLLKIKETKSERIFTKEIAVDNLLKNKIKNNSKHKERIPKENEQ